MRKRSLGLRKATGCSWIELESDVHVFFVEDRTHPHCNAIYATLEHLTSNINSLQWRLTSLKQNTLIDKGHVSCVIHSPIS